MQYKLKTLVVAIGLVVASTTSYAAPQAPGLELKVEGTIVTAFWNTVLGASEYTIYYAPFPALTPIGTIPMGGKTDFTVDLPVGASFAVAIKSKDASGESGFSNIENFTVDTLDPADANASISSIISSTGANVILNSYEDFADKARLLNDAMLNFKFTPTDDNLRTLQFAWRDTRRPWEQTEAYLFGPVDTQGIDPAIDSWPVNRIDLDSVLNSSATLDVPTVNALEETTKGFHTIEYLIFGPASTKTTADFTERELEYLISSTTLLHSNINALADAWRPTAGNFLNELATAGRGSATYPSEAAALQELINGMIVIADEVGNGKLSDPFAESNPELVESQFSFNSLLDFEHNIRGIENIYLGRYLQKDGPGLNDLVQRNDSSLDAEIRQKIDDAINGIQDIPFPFRDSISTTEGRAAIEIAIDKVVDLQTLLESKLLPNIASYQ